MSKIIIWLNLQWIGGNFTGFYFVTLNDLETITPWRFLIDLVWPRYTSDFNQGCGALTFLVGSGSGSGSGEEFWLRLRLRLRVKLFGGSGSGSGSGSYDQVLIWALTSNTILKNAKCQNMTSHQGCARLMSRESNLTRLRLKWVESELSRPWKSRIWVESESNHTDRHLSQSWVNWILLESKLSHSFFWRENVKILHLFAASQGKEPTFSFIWPLHPPPPPVSDF